VIAQAHRVQRCKGHTPPRERAASLLQSWKLCTCQAHDHCASPAVLARPNPRATLLVSHERVYTEARQKLIASATVVPP
jgi:hypothetical protein